MIRFLRDWFAPDFRAAQAYHRQRQALRRAVHRNIPVILFLSTVLLAGLAAPAPVEAHGTTKWARLSHCESGHRWHLHNPPYSGGLQFVDSTWAAYGGRALPPDGPAPRRAHRASRAQQIRVAKRVAWRGWRGTPPQGGSNAWPVCWGRS